VLVAWLITEYTKKRWIKKRKKADIWEINCEEAETKTNEGATPTLETPSSEAWEAKIQLIPSLMD